MAVHYDTVAIFCTSIGISQTWQLQIILAICKIRLYTSLSSNIRKESQQIL